MATTALGIAPDKTGAGVTALAHRRIIQSRYTNPGVIEGLAVTGRSDLRYQVASGVAVCCRAEADGYTEAYFEGGQTPEVAAGAASPRIDVIWICAHDLEQGDADNHVVIGVTQGAASDNPVAPDAPDGCTAIAWRTMPANATRTASSTVDGSVNYARLRGGTMGVIGKSVNTYNKVGSADVNRHYVEQPVTFHLETDRVLQLNFKCNFSCSKPDNKDMSHRTELGVQFQLDGKVVPHSASLFVSYWAWESHETSVTVTVPKGSHTIAIDSWLGNGYAPQYHYSDGSALWVGRELTVIDLGAAL